MSRGLTGTNQSASEAATVQPTTLAKIEFDTPVYVHSGLGTITYDGDDYLGVGDLGQISGIEEAEDNSPTPIRLSLSQVDAAYLSEGLSADNFRDKVTLFMGYRQDDGTLVDDPWVIWKGYIEYTSIQSETGTITLHCQHFLSILKQKDGRRYTDEEQQRSFTGDLGFQFIADVNGTQLTWGAENRVNTPYSSPGPGGTPRRDLNLP